jgi:hypothetical protein
MRDLPAEVNHEGRVSSREEGWKCPQLLSSTSAAGSLLHCRIFWYGIHHLIDRFDAPSVSPP